MNVIVFASRKGGSGKSTLAAHLATHANRPNRPCLLIDADPQGSLTLWQQLRGTGEPKLKPATRDLGAIIKAAKEEFEWVFVDTPPNMSPTVTDAIRAATLVVIPARPTLFNLSAVKETIDFARHFRKPYAVVLNAAPSKRDETESPIVTRAREALAKFPVWGGQITNRVNFSLALVGGEGVKEFAGESQAASEMARLWAAIEKSVKAIHGAYDGATMHKAAA
jgi:chromosome partitioning protein